MRLEKEGKNAGCWVMPLAQSEEFAGLEDPDKVIVRSDGTVTYVGKDIAYQLWKFGLLGRDFGYRDWDEQGVWETTPRGRCRSIRPSAAAGGSSTSSTPARATCRRSCAPASSRSATPPRPSARSTSPTRWWRCRRPPPASSATWPRTPTTSQLEMSGRKGIGVKADDLLDQLVAKSREEIASRNRDLDEASLDRLAREIAVAALRFFMVKATTNRVIAFDFDEALSFEGDSGPYLQYSLVRARNIRRRLAAAGLADEVAAADVAALPDELLEDDLWDLVLAVAQVGELAERAADSLEISLVARGALEIAQRFNAVYHRHPILQEEDPARRAARLAAVQAFGRGLETLCGLLGIPVPDKM